jgi:ferredoxin--NADP+ reductase/benzoate/toluate 1,2-dioxygenase reductase subunit
MEPGTAAAGTAVMQTECRVHHVRDLSPSAYVLRFDRNALEFRPGQCVLVGLKGRPDMREYTIYSGPQEDYLEILVKEIEGGVVSRGLRRCRPGDLLAVQGPIGFFTVDEESRRDGEFLFVASGTGISPYHCFSRSYPGLRYRVLHGVRSSGELYDREVFDPRRFTSCVTRDHSGDYRGRVTDYLREHPADPQSFCYLCGNCSMIHEAFDILKSQGVPRDRLFAEVYF